jgi:hypothetical protein
MSKTRKTVKRSPAGRFAKGSAGGPGRPGKLTDTALAEIARDFRCNIVDVQAMLLLEDREELERLLEKCPAWLAARIRRCNNIADLAEAALVRRLKAAAGL